MDEKYWKLLKFTSVRVHEHVQAIRFQAFVVG